LSLRDGPLGDVRPPILWVAAVALAVAAVAALVLFLGDRREGARVYAVSRNAAAAVIAPVGGVLATPFRWIGGGFDSARDYVLAGAENADLKLPAARSTKVIASTGSARWSMNRKRSISPPQKLALPNCGRSSARRLISSTAA